MSFKNTLHTIFISFENSSKFMLHLSKFLNSAKIQPNSQTSNLSAKRFQIQPNLWDLDVIQSNWPPHHQCNSVANARVQQCYCSGKITGDLL